MLGGFRSTQIEDNGVFTSNIHSQTCFKRSTKGIVFGVKIRYKTNDLKHERNPLTERQVVFLQASAQRYLKLSDQKPDSQGISINLVKIPLQERKYLEWMVKFDKLPKNSVKMFLVLKNYDYFPLKHFIDIVQCIFKSFEGEMCNFLG